MTSKDTRCHMKKKNIIHDHRFYSEKGEYTYSLVETFGLY